MYHASTPPPRRGSPRRAGHGGSIPGTHLAKTLAQQGFFRRSRPPRASETWTLPPWRARICHASTAGPSPASWPCRFDLPVSRFIDSGSTSRRLTALAWPLAISHQSPDRQRPRKVEHTVRRLAGGLPFGGHLAVSQAFTRRTLEKLPVGAQFAQCLQGQGFDRAQCGAGEGGDLVLSVAAEIR